MIISEITDCTIVLEKYHECWDFMAMREVYIKGGPLRIFKNDCSFEQYTAQDALFSPDIIILYFNSVPKEFKAGDIIGLKIGIVWYEYNYENSRTK